MSLSGEGDITDAMLAVMDPVAVRDAVHPAGDRRPGHDADHAVLRIARLARPSRPATSFARRPKPDPERGRGDRALGEPAALLPSYRDAKTPRSAAPRSARATRSPCTTRPATATRTCSPTASRSTSRARRTSTSSFGQAEHFCVGVHLARLEGRIFYEELLSRFTRIEVVGKPKRLRSNLNNSYKEMRVVLTPR